MADEVLTLDRRSLTRILPGLRVVGAIRLAFDLRKLVVAAVGLELLRGGWALLDWLFPGSVGAATPALPDFAAPISAGGEGEVVLWDLASRLVFRLLEPFRLLTTPLLTLLEPASSAWQMLHALLGLIWLIAVWGICGGMISRIALLQIGRMQQPGIKQALKFALGHAASLIVAPLCPLLALAFCALFVAAFGVLYRVPVIGLPLAGVVFFIPLAIGLVMALLVAGLIAGWPLMQAALAAGADDALDALSRTFAYLNQRLGPFAAMLVLAAVEGIVGLFLMDLLAVGVFRLTDWALSLTAPAAQIAVAFGAKGEPIGFVSYRAHMFWLGVVRLLVHSWTYSFSWTVASFLYLWLRQDVDGTPWTDLGPPD